MRHQYFLRHARQRVLEVRRIGDQTSAALAPGTSASVAASNPAVRDSQVATVWPASISEVMTSRAVTVLLTGHRLFQLHGVHNILAASNRGHHYCDKHDHQCRVVEYVRRWY